MFITGRRASTQTVGMLTSSSDEPDTRRQSRISSYTMHVHSPLILIVLSIELTEAYNHRLSCCPSKEGGGVASAPFVECRYQSSSTTAALVAVFHKVGTTTPWERNGWESKEWKGEERDCYFNHSLILQEQVNLVKKATQYLCKNNTRLVVLVTQACVLYYGTHGITLHKLVLLE